MREVSPLAISAAASTAHACAATAAAHEPPTPPTPAVAAPEALGQQDIAFVIEERRVAEINEKAVRSEYRRLKVAHDRKQARFTAKMEKLGRARTRTLKGSFAMLQMMDKLREEMLLVKYDLLLTELQVAQAERDTWRAKFDVHAMSRPCRERRFLAGLGCEGWGSRSRVYRGARSSSLVQRGCPSDPYSRGVSHLFCIYHAQNVP